LFLFVNSIAQKLHDLNEPKPLLERAIFSAYIWSFASTIIAGAKFNPLWIDILNVLILLVFSVNQ
jgi:hypothetical protein